MDGDKSVTANFKPVSIHPTPLTTPTEEPQTGGGGGGCFIGVAAELSE